MTLHDQVRVLPTGPGVYRFRDGCGRVIYLGRATSLRSRVGSYFTASFTAAGRGSRRHLRRMIPQVERIEALATASVHEAAWLERNLHHRTLPRWNRVRGGAEVPQLIRVIDGPRAASVVVDHLTGRTPDRPPVERVFGPYLGGLRVRTAVTGLRRVWPIGFTGAGLTASERDLGAVRGVGTDDRSRLVHGLIATLSGDPEVVAHTLAELTRRRAAAAGAESYELAARVHEEIAAVEWVTSTQRVTRLVDAHDGADEQNGADGSDEHDGDEIVAGWADGILVTWTIRAGRLDGWAMRECGAAAARRHLDQTALGWREFATTNAALAAQLRSAR